MESRNEEGFSRSLPPLVEGKVHGYLRLVIDEIVWSRRSPGDVTVLASWWGELDSAQFRPADIKSGDDRPESDTSETYAIRTNLELFEEYLKNCESVELVVISEKNHQVVGTARVVELANLLSGKSYFQYVPILNDNGGRTGDVHVTMKLTNVQKASKSQLKKCESKISPGKPSFEASSRRTNSATARSYFSYENDVPVAIKNAKQNENVYRSILKERRSDLDNPGAKSFGGVNDKLVAQVVARAQRLRGAIIKETREEDPLALSESSTIDSFRSDPSVNKETNLYKYFLGQKMSRWEEKRALDALRTTSPTPSLIDLAAETIRTCRSDKNVPVNAEDKIPPSKPHGDIDDFSTPESSVVPPPREISPMDYVDSLRIAVESLTLTSAGHRRVRSSCLSRGDGIPLSVTYFVQYDSTFGNAKKFNRKIIDESKPVKLSSKKQVGQVVYFNHDAVYDLPKSYLHTDVPLKFKIFHRHLNQRTPTELGIGATYVADAARSRSLSSTQRLAIVNKGIKIGELKVTAELGCDKIHFGKQFVEAVTSAKENIPVLEVSSVSTLETPRYRTATGNESEENAKAVPSSAGEPDDPCRSNNVGGGRREAIRRRAPRDEERIVEQEDRFGDRVDKILLHGLIHVAEGKDLSPFGTYIVCRAFWREDKAASRICDEAPNPRYNFHQIVPLVHGQDLLERTRNNCVVIEVYARKENGSDELLGISKLSVHRLYLAYSDPRVLSQLLSSKYPVISVDEWVPVAHPVSGRPCGQIRALVALGTADQIALLEMTRGLRESGGTSRNFENSSRIPAEFSRATGSPGDTENSQDHDNPTMYRKGSRERDNRRGNSEDSEDRALKDTSCQTEITTVKYFKGNSGEEDLTSENPRSHVLNAIVDRLAQALNVPKNIADQSAQTEFDARTLNENLKTPEIEPLNLNLSTNNSFSVGSSSNSEADSQRHHFLSSREIYRSVGVGAEFDDPDNLGPSTSYANTNSVAISELPDAPEKSSTNLARLTNDNHGPGFGKDVLETVSTNGLHENDANEDSNSERSDNENSSFRAVVEIECALHLPRIERINDTVEPCTYVTFQKARNHNGTQYGCYVVTNLFPFSCSPKWDWRSDTKLSNHLLDDEEKRLILKVWRLADPETSMKINLEKDIVIGFAAIDVSVLTVGFPVVSGWFHVMDFTGKCNGQIKVSVTPLDNIAAFVKTTGQSSTSRPALPEFDRSNFSPPYLAESRNVGEALNSGRSNAQEAVINRSLVEQEPMLNIGLNLGDASMSFLSLSLEQKLTELDEIKKRLQTRLQAVTNIPFDDDFEDDFDGPIVGDDNEGVNDPNGEDFGKPLRDMENWRIPPRHTDNSHPAERCNAAKDNGHRNFEALENLRCGSNSASIEANFTDTGYSTSSHLRSCRNNSSGHSENDDNRSRRSSEENLIRAYGDDSSFAGSANPPNVLYAIQAANLLRNGAEAPNGRNYQSARSEIPDFLGSGETSNEDRPKKMSDDNAARGTRMPISHLLEKLTTQLTAVPPPITNRPMKRNIMDLITSLRKNNNNSSSDRKCNREINVRTVPTQTEMSDETPLAQISTSSKETRDNSIAKEKNRGSEDTETPAKIVRRNNKVSTAIREELAAEEAFDCDELSSHLMTTNVRHMDLQSPMNPLLYSHLLPDVGTTSNGGTGIDEQNTTNSSGTPEVDAIERMETRYTENFNTTINNGLSRLRNLMETESTSRRAQSLSETSENNDESFRTEPSGIPENIYGNIDVTVIHKPCNDDLMASNSVESTTTLSIDLLNSTEIDDNSSLNSTQTSVSGVSRQAPDGGNPVEESGASNIAKSRDDSRDSSSTT